MNRYLITGGAGFIGSNLAKGLATANKDNEIIILDNFSSGDFRNLLHMTNITTTLNVIADDILSESWWEKVGKVDAIFHQAAVTDTTLIDDQRKILQVNVEGFRNVIHYALEFDVQKIIYASSAAVYGNLPCPMKEDMTTSPLNIYGFSKMAMENIAYIYSKKYKKLNFIGLRYFNVYGEGEIYKGKSSSMIYQIYKQLVVDGKTPKLFQYGEQKRDFVHVKDVVQANLRALDLLNTTTTRGKVPLTLLQQQPPSMTSDSSTNTINQNAKPSTIALSSEPLWEEKNRGNLIFNVGSGESMSFNNVLDIIYRSIGYGGDGHDVEYIENPYTSFYQNNTRADLEKSRKILGWSPTYKIDYGIREYIKILEKKINKQNSDQKEIQS